MLVPVILSGGAGTRLWPVSRSGAPKPFITLANGESLLAMTYRRAAGVLARGAPEAEGHDILTVTHRDYYFQSKDEWFKVGLGEQQRSAFLLEPMGRNTAPAVAMAAHWVRERFGPKATLLVLPADHWIDDTVSFEATVAEAVALAQEGWLVTFGIAPSAPESGYGYIEAGEPLAVGQRVRRFVEKPTKEVAQAFLATGNFYWNSGMFCFQAETVLEELGRAAPEVAEAVASCWAQGRGKGGEAVGMVELPAEPFSRCPDISLDHALLERSERVAVIPARFPWSDLGSWSALGALMPADAKGNRATGEAIFLDSRETYVHGEARMIAAVGVEGLVIVDTPDALLVADREHVQDVKKVVALLEQQGHESCRQHRTVVRPWGTYTVLEEGPGFKIKRIEVKPGASLSLQMHHHRSEHWVVVRGMARIINGEQECYVRPNESTYIPAGCKHRLENPGLLDLVMIEVQCGEYLGEDDIVRLQDDYGRCA